MKFLVVLFMLGFCALNAQADGLSPMPLEKVLPRADIVVLAEIVSNKVTVVKRNTGEGRASVVSTCSIKATVLEDIKASAPKKLDLTFKIVVVKGMWLSWPGSGQEDRMKSKEKYVLLLENRNNSLRLLRAEKATRLDAIRKLLKQNATKKQASKTEG